MSESIEIDLPERHIGARALRERVQGDACGLPLTSQLGHVNAYVVHCATGPYLMTVREWDHYVKLCQSTAKPLSLLAQP